MVSIHWTPEEEKYLEQHFETGNKDDIVKKLDRTWLSIKKKAYKLGLKRQNLGKGRKAWLREEEKYLEHNFAILSKEELRKYLNRTWLSIQNRAHKLGLTRPDFHQKEWTKEEDTILQRMYPRSSQEEILQKLDWDWNAVCRRAEKIGVKRDSSYIHTEYRESSEGNWTPEELKYLEENFESTPKREIEEVLGRQWSAILAHAWRKGLKRDKKLAYERRQHPSSWTEEEIQILEDNCEGKSVANIAKMLPDRTEAAVRGMACRREVLPSMPIWTPEEDKIIRQHFEEGDPLEILDLLSNRTWGAIGERARKTLGLKRKRKIHYSERRMKKLLDQIFIDEKHQDNVWPKWLVNPETGKRLELDRYYPYLKIAFEYNGSQHYTSTAFSSGSIKDEKRIERQMRSDKAKREICAKQGVTLIVVKYSDHLTLENLREIIDKYLQQELSADLSKKPAKF